MNYNGTIYRPPVEAYTLLLPITEGCSHNSCKFCNMYQNIPFRMLSLAEVEDFLKKIFEFNGENCQQVEKIYLVGADPFALPAKKLLERADLIKKYLPNVKIISMYARTDNISKKSDEDLKILKDAGFNDLYLGVECGLNDVLKNLNKGYSADETKKQCLRLNFFGINHCDLLMLGTAGKNRGIETAIATAKLENEIKPTKILLNTMSAFVGTILDEEIKTKKFIPAGEKEIFIEEKIFLENLKLPETYFWAVHPLDSVRIDGILKNDKEKMLKILSQAIETVDETKYNRISRRGTL